MDHIEIWKDLIELHCVHFVFTLFRGAGLNSTEPLESRGLAPWLEDFHWNPHRLVLFVSFQKAFFFSSPHEKIPEGLKLLPGSHVSSSRRGERFRMCHRIMIVTVLFNPDELRDVWMGVGTSCRHTGEYGAFYCHFKGAVDVCVREEKLLMVFRAAAGSGLITQLLLTLLIAKNTTLINHARVERLQISWLYLMSCHCCCCCWISPECSHITCNLKFTKETKLSRIVSLLLDHLLHN